MNRSMVACEGVLEDPVHAIHLNTKVTMACDKAIPRGLHGCAGDTRSNTEV